MAESPDQLLREWYDLWAAPENQWRAKLPNALHVRTALYLQDVDTARDSQIDVMPSPAESLEDRWNREVRMSPRELREHMNRERTGFGD